MLYVTLGVSNSQASLEELIELTDTRVANEIYADPNGTFEISEVYLSYAEAELGQGFTVEQNAPNPFNGETNISFFQPRDGEVEFKIVDLSGRQLVQHTKTYTKGWNNIAVQADDLPGAGIYIYEMSNGQSKVRRKMITIK